MATDFRLKDQLPNLTERLVKTYEEIGTINHLGHCPLPNYDEVIAVLAELQEILFPGYRRREGLHASNIKFYVGDLVDRLHDRLTQQIGHAHMLLPNSASANHYYFVAGLGLLIKVLIALGNMLLAGSRFKET